MATITLVLAIAANIVAIFTLLMSISMGREMNSMEEGLRDCATRTRYNTINFDTFKNEVSSPKPKAKRGRPRKNAPKPHKNGKQ